MANIAASQGQQLVINMSLSYPITPEFEQLVASTQNTVLYVIASGNGNDNQLSQPSSLAQQYNNVIAVGASWGKSDVFGNLKKPGDRISYGFPPNAWGSNYGNGLTLMGPSEVVTTKAAKDLSTADVRYNYYDYANDFSGSPDRTDMFNGTSAATPNVTGVASLVWSANPNLTAGQVKDILAQTAVDLGPRGYDLVTGSGFVNADTAVRRAIAIGQGFA